MKPLFFLACAAVFASLATGVQAFPGDGARGFWEHNAPTCDGYPSKDSCDDGDMVLFGGLLCSSGDTRGCDLVRAAQSSDGQWWRSPRRNPGNLGASPTFSRDMAMGVLLYLSKTHDRDAAVRWLDWLDHNRPCLVEKPLHGGCLIRGPHRFCRDERNQICTLTPGNWGLLGRVWRALDLPLSHEMRLNENVDAAALPVQAEAAAIGYELHLLAVEVLLKQRLSGDSADTRAAAAILQRRQPGNPFFTFLHTGATPELRERLLRLCPTREGAPWTEHRQWAWERGTDSQAWTASMGWDCLFLANLLD